MTLEEYLAAALADGLSREEAMRRWDSVRGWGAAPPDPVFWSPPQSDDVDAAAAPIEVDPTPRLRGEMSRRMQDAGYTADEAEMAAAYEGTMPGAYSLPESDETLRRGAAYQREQDRRMGAFDSTLAEIYGHGPSGAVAPARSLSVDGVTVPSVLGSDGQPLGDGQYYRLGDVKREQIAKMDAERSAAWRSMIDSDKAQYGDPMLSDDEVSPEQYENRLARKRAEVAEQNSPRAKELRRGRLHARAGIPEEATEDMSEEQVLRMMARNKQQAQAAGARAMITRRAQAQQNPLEYLNNPEVDQWSKMVAANAMLRGRMPQRTPIDVDVARGANAAELAKVQVMDREVDARMEALNNQFEQARDDRKMQNDQFLLKMEEMRADRDRLAGADRERFDIARTEAANRHTALMGELELGRARNETEQEKYRSVIESQQAQKDAERTMTQKLRELEFQRQSPGLYDVITGRPSTEAAIDALKAIAAQSDNFQWLPGGGFGEREATAMNDELLGLARQAEILGIESRLTDPAYRRELIKQWGYSSGWSGGRGGWMGDWWQPMPEDLR